MNQVQLPRANSTPGPAQLLLLIASFPHYFPPFNVQTSLFSLVISTILLVHGPSGLSLRGKDEVAAQAYFRL